MKLKIYTAPSTYGLATVYQYELFYCIAHLLHKIAFPSPLLSDYVICERSLRGIYKGFRTKGGAVASAMFSKHCLLFSTCECAKIIRLNVTNVRASREGHITCGHSRQSVHCIIKHLARVPDQRNFRKFQQYFWNFCHTTFPKLSSHCQVSHYI